MGKYFSLVLLKYKWRCKIVANNAHKKVKTDGFIHVRWGAQKSTIDFVYFYVLKWVTYYNMPLVVSWYELFMT